MLRFSVIVPVYNIEKDLPACVDSVLAQEFSDYELLLVDDGSVDGSGALCDAYADKNPEKVQVIHKENGGLSDARNAGVKAARGDYLVFLDGDDYIHAKTLLWMQEALEGILAEGESQDTDSGKNLPVDVILSEGMYNDRVGTITLEASLQRENAKDLTGPEAIAYTSSLCCNWSACGKAYRRAFWMEQDYAFVKGRLAEDMQLIDRVVLEAERVTMIPSYYYYRRREDSIMHTISPRFIEHNLLNFQDWQNYFAEHTVEKTCEDGILKYMAANYAHHVMAYISLMDKETQPALFEKVKQHRWLASYIPGNEGLLIRLSLRVFGMKMTCKMLGRVKARRLAK